MIIIRGIPIVLIICFFYFFFLETAKRYIPNKEWHDFIQYITYGLALLYASVGSVFFGIAFYDSLQVILGLLASDSVFSLINKLIPESVDRFERNIKTKKASKK